MGTAAVVYWCIQLRMRRKRGLVSGTHDQMFAVFLPRKIRALYDRIMLPLTNFVVRTSLRYFIDFAQIQTGVVFERRARLC